MINHYEVIDVKQARNKKIIMRVDFNVPMQDGKILDDTRIKRVIPGLKMLADCAKQIFLVTHLGRPRGIPSSEFSVQPLQEYLKGALSRNVSFTPYVDDVTKLSEILEKKEKICLLENCRFYPGEEKNDAELARNFAKVADIYVNDAFSCSHRAHASIQSITKFLPSYAGPVLAKELAALHSALENPGRPVAAFVGGAKISTKALFSSKGRFESELNYVKVNSNDAEYDLPPESFGGYLKGRNFRMYARVQYFHDKTTSFTLSLNTMNNYRYKNLINMQGEIRAYF